MRDFSYTKDDVNYYLEARQKIKRQLNIYLRDKLSSADENKQIIIISKILMKII